MAKKAKSSRKKSRQKELRKSLGKIQRKLSRIDGKLDALIERLCPAEDRGEGELPEPANQSETPPGGEIVELPT